MSLLSLFILSVGLAMDAFAVSVCKGLAMKKYRLYDSVIVGLWFGIFQAVMPLIGYLLGSQFKDKITQFSHWIAFVLLLFIGLNMIKEALSHEEDSADSSLSFKTMLILAIATSIDALAVGVSLAFLKVNIIFAILCIGIVTFAISFSGVKIGSVFGTKYKSKAELAGGIILILLGVKILLEHFNII